MFDYAIIGAGAAGLNLALAMSEEPWFAQKKILIIEKSEKQESDRVWSYWERGTSPFNAPVEKSWGRTVVEFGHQRLSFGLNDYRYQTLDSKVFHDYVKQQIGGNEQFTWVTEEVVRLREADDVEIVCRSQSFRARHVFDSRLENEVVNRLDGYPGVLQHFKGWFVRFDEPVLDDTVFTMMDFGPKAIGTTSFVYVLPFSQNYALFEFTFFDNSVLNGEAYDQLLTAYMSHHFPAAKYTVEKTEKGVVPMSMVPFHTAGTDRITKIGTAGGWVKPSTGYSFMRSRKMTRKVVDNLKNGRKPIHGLFSKRHRLYDWVMLDVLSRHNELGEDVFRQMYQRNDIELILRFLDEETNLVEELLFMNTFDKKLFLKSVGRWFLRG